MANMLKRSMLATAIVVLLAVECINGVPLAKKNKAIRKRQNDVNFLGVSNLPGEQPTPPADVETVAPTVAPELPTVAPVAPTELPTQAAETSPAPIETLAPTIAPTLAPIESTVFVPIETSSAAPLIPESTSARLIETAAPTTAALLETSPAAIMTTTIVHELPTTTVVQELPSTTIVQELPSTASRAPLIQESTTIVPRVTKENPTHLVDQTVFACGAEHDPKKNYPSQKEPCSHHFYSCSGPDNQAWEFTCPVNMYFDQALNECHAFLDVPACTGSPRPATPSTQAPQPTRPTARPAYDCSARSDGLYADPTSTPKPLCGNRYFQCVGGRTQEFHCDRGLVFNTRLSNGGGCDYEYRVFDCTGQQFTEIVHTNPPIVTWAPVQFDCSRQKDGYFADKCANHYFSCSNGYARLMQCPAPNLAFDPDTKQCLVRTEVILCGGSKRTTPIPPVTVETITLSTKKPALDCYGRADGDYRDPENKCSRVFYKCTNNRTFVEECPGNLFYNPITLKCDNWPAIYDCSGVSPTPAILTSPPTPVPTFPTVDFDCSRRLDGDYANPASQCSTFFYKCSNALAFKIECYEGLYYNPQAPNPHCDSWMNVFGCSNMTRPPTTQAPITARPTTLRPVYECSGKADGFYVDPENKCSAIYYYCQLGYGVRMECNRQSNLVWDDLSKQCNWRTETYACTGVMPTRPPPPTPSTARPTFAAIEYDCLEKLDGDYAELENNCSSVYITCTGGYALQRPCPPNQFFDPETRRCDHRQYIVACGGRPMIVETGPKTTRRPRPTYPFDCTKRYDGLYPAGDCERFYYSCVGGLTDRLECDMAVGLVFDVELNQCSYKFEVPKCGGKRPTSAPITSRRPTTPSVFDCSRKFDGNYQDPVNKCSQRFFQCANGFTYVQPCGAGALYYDQVSDKCLRFEMVPACRGETGAPALPTTVKPTNELTSIIAPVETSRPSIIASSIIPGGPSSTLLPAESTLAPIQPSIAQTTTIVPLPAESTTLAPLPAESTLAPVQESTLAPLPAESTLAPIPEASTLLPPVQESTLAPIIPAETSSLGPLGGESSSLAPQPPALETSSIEPVSPPLPTIQ